jgi:hypothetical protein
MCFVAVPVGVWLATLNHWNKGVCLYPNWYLVLSQSTYKSEHHILK